MIVSANRLRRRQGRRTRRRATRVELTVLMPCLNEEATLATCLVKIRRTLEEHEIIGEILVADNGSSDRSREIARAHGARVVTIEEKGYGAALIGGIAAARGEYVVMGDADDSYNFAHIPRFLDQLRAGDDLVMGNRFRGGIEPGAMPVLHRYLGNPVLSAIGRLFFQSPVGDFYCGLRGFRRGAIDQLDLRTTGMEFALEMVVKATLFDLRISEVPTTLQPDGRNKPPHLRTWRDGWRGLRFMLLYSPTWLFLLPGLLLILLGLCGGTAAVASTSALRGDQVLLFAAAAVLVGYQGILISFSSDIYAIAAKLRPNRPWLAWSFRYITLETGLVAGLGMLAAGAGLSAAAVLAPSAAEQNSLRTAVPGMLLLVLGAQTMIASFFMSMLGLSKK